MSRGRKPTYRLLITEKFNKKSKTFAGVAFAGNFNSLNICLNPGVRLDWRDMDSVWLTLVPYTGDYNAPDVDPGPASDVEEPTKVEQAETSANDDKPEEGRPPSRDDDFPF
jgi:hypothetical protein